VIRAGGTLRSSASTVAGPLRTTARQSRHNGLGAFTVQVSQRAHGRMMPTFAVVLVGASFPLATPRGWPFEMTTGT
jgi:hypothetical protein